MLVYIQLLTGEIFIYETEDLYFHKLLNNTANTADIQFVSKDMYFVNIVQDAEGRPCFSFIRADNDIFCPANIIYINRSSFAKYYYIDSNAEINETFKNIKVRESAKKSGIKLVK